MGVKDGNEYLSTLPKRGIPADAITNASTAHALNATFSDTEVETALNNLGTTLNSVLAALRDAGLVKE